jgi:hypothetical protein
MTLISPAYRKLNRQLHDTGNFGGSGYRWVDDVRSRITGRNKRITSLLDYGCGQGTFWIEFEKKYPNISQGIRYWEYDPCYPGKTDFPKGRLFDLVVCTDVLEHVEPEFLDNVIITIFKLARRCLFFNIAMLPANKKLPDGRNAHLIVEGKDWWIKKIFFLVGDVIKKVEFIPTRRADKDLNIWFERRCEI